jgi:AcrR family transcriptional regulator
VLLREIAAEAQVTPQTLHARFGSKEELFVAAYGWFGERETSDRPAMPTTDGPAARAGRTGGGGDGPGVIERPGLRVTGADLRCDLGAWVVGQRQQRFGVLRKVKPAEHDARVLKALGEAS